MMEQHLLFTEALLFLGQLSEDQKHSPLRQKSEGSQNFVKMLPALLLQEILWKQDLFVIACLMHKVLPLYCLKKPIWKLR
jgi:hypothetical protein